MYMARCDGRCFTASAMLGLIFILSFSGGESADVDYALNKEEMVEISREIHLLEAKIDRLSLKTDSAAKLYQHFEQLVFDKYNTDSATYYLAYKQYGQNPKLFFKIYTTVVDSLMSFKNREKLKDQKARKKSKAGSMNEKADSLGEVSPQRQVVDTLKTSMFKSK